MRLRERIKETSEITDLGSISRRYFVIGAFDGALTVLGVVLGAYAAGAAREHMEIVLYAGLSAGVALAISSSVGAYEAERVEKLLAKASLERALLRGFPEEHAEAYKLAALISALVHGIAPIIAAVIPLLPFFIIADMAWATLVSVFMTLCLLFIMGAYLGNLVKERIFMTGMRFVLAGLATAVILMLVGAG
ncbi:MAG: VIT1/CCC1 transporter family protein [Thermoplasmata archaeon]